MEIVCAKCKITVLGEGTIENTKMVCELCLNDPSRYLLIDEYKALRKIEIKANTEILFDKGFIYNDLTFGLSDWECTKWLGISCAGESQFPIPVLSKERVFIDLTFDTAKEFYDCAFSRGRLIEVEQAKLLYAIAQAQSIDEVKAVIDTRE